MASITNNGVSWRQVFVLLLPVMLLPVGVCWALIESHAGQPHRDSVHVREFERLRADLHEIKSDIRSLREEVRLLR